MPEASAGGVLDTHVHLWDPSRRRHAWLDDPALAPLRRRFDLDDHRAAAAGGVSGRPVAGVVLVQALNDTDESLELCAVACADPDVVGVVGWVDLTDPAVADRLADLAAAGRGKLCGIRHLVQDEPDVGWLARPDVRRGLAAVSRAGLTFDLLLTPAHLPVATATAQAVPHLTFVLDHAAKPGLPAGGTAWDTWVAGLRRLAGCPNVSAKLSGFATFDGATGSAAEAHAVFEVLLEAFGVRRLMVGSDWPVCLLGTSWNRWAATLDAVLAPLSDDDRAAVLHDTAHRVYGTAADATTTAPTREPAC